MIVKDGELIPLNTTEVTPRKPLPLITMVDPGQADCGIELIVAFVK